MRSPTGVFLFLCAFVLCASGCGGGSGGSGIRPLGFGSSPSDSETGTLTLTVKDGDGRPLPDAQVTVYDTAQTKTKGTGVTDQQGVVTVNDIPATALVYVFHEFAEPYRNPAVNVAQQGVTSMAVTLQPARPRPSAALLPVTVVPGSVSADRREITLQISVVASAAGSFHPAEYGYDDGTVIASPAMGLVLESWDAWGDPRVCEIWLSQARPTPTCGDWNDPANSFTATVEAFTYDPTGTAAAPATPGAPQSAMLLMDQSERVATLDPYARRSFAARRFLERAIATGRPQSLSIGGFAADGGMTTTQPLLPSTPLWVPLADSSSFTGDGAMLNSAIETLEPLTGGKAPVLDGIKEALAFTATRAPMGDRTLVALLGGGDDSSLSEMARQDALTALRQQRDATGVQAILIVGAPASNGADRLAIADLARALRAPTIAMDSDSRSHWTRGAFAALDLAADLMDGQPLPIMSASIRVKSSGRVFDPGSVLHGAIFLEGESCGMGCNEFPLEFSVVVP